MIGIITVTLIYCNNDMFDGLEKVFDPTLLNPSHIAVSEDSKILLFQIPPQLLHHRSLWTRSLGFPITPPVTCLFIEIKKFGYCHGEELWEL